MGLPEGWNDYSRIGKQVHGTRFIAFKVPLREGINRGCQVPDEKQLYPKLLVSLIPNLGLIIDLTNTTKYYNPEEFLKLDVAYHKVMVAGRQIPHDGCFNEFRDIVNDYLAENEDKLIGVHCTHGLNRTGYMICRYMIEEMQIPAIEAIAKFEVARGHKMERDNYIDRLKRLTVSDASEPKKPRNEKLPSLAIDTDIDKGCQTNRGFWIDETSLQPHHRNAASAGVSTVNEPPKQVSLVGCVNVQQRDLIPDGRGGYFIRVTKKEIKRHDANRSKPPNNNQGYYQPPAQLPHNMPNRGNRPNPNKRQPYQNRPYMSRPPPDFPMGGPIINGPIYNPMSNPIYQQHQFRPNIPPPHIPNSLPPGSNNIAENLLGMRKMHSQRPRTNQPF